LRRATTATRSDLFSVLLNCLLSNGVDVTGSSAVRLGR
jgi:hypothetical protein